MTFNGITRQFITTNVTRYLLKVINVTKYESRIFQAISNGAGRHKLGCNCIKRVDILIWRNTIKGHNKFPTRCRLGCSLNWRLVDSVSIGSHDFLAASIPKRLIHTDPSVLRQRRVLTNQPVKSGSHPTTSHHSIVHNSCRRLPLFTDVACAPTCVIDWLSGV